MSFCIGVVNNAGNVLFRPVKVVLVDNYDSFTYNLLHGLQIALGEVVSVQVMRNDELDYTQLNSAQALVFSPGPGIPEEAGDLMKVIREFHGKIPLLGVCLGFQAIGRFYGADLIQLDEPVHGYPCEIQVLDPFPFFEALHPVQVVGRYHSWGFAARNFPDALKILALDDKDQVMAFADIPNKIAAVQFHPESILTENGKAILHNGAKWLLDWSL